MALKFEEIEDIVFDGKQVEEMSALERAACGELKYLLQELQKGHIIREQATQAKLKLRNKYECCQKHNELIGIIKNFILKAQWDCKDSENYIDDLLMGANSIATHPDVKDGFSLYSDFSYDTVRYFDKQLNGTGKFTEYQKLLYKKPEDRSEEEKKIVNRDFTQYCFYRIGYEPGNEKTAELLMDMPTLWNKLLDLRDLGEGEKIDMILTGLRELYKAINEVSI